MENISAMATGKFALSTLHEISWPWQLEKIALSTLHEIFGHCNGGKALQEKCHVKRALQKNVMLSQQGVRFVISSRGKKKKCEVILSVFCLSLENYLLYLCLQL